MVARGRPVKEWTGGYQWEASLTTPPFAYLLRLTSQRQKSALSGHGATLAETRTLTAGLVVGIEQVALLVERLPVECAVGICEDTHIYI